jgi:hypothetical protein
MILHGTNILTNDFLNVESKKGWDKWATKREILTSRAKLPFGPGWCYHPRQKGPPFVTGGNTTRD